METVRATLFTTFKQVLDDDEMKHEMKHKTLESLVTQFQTMAPEEDFMIAFLTHLDIKDIGCRFIYGMEVEDYLASQFGIRFGTRRKHESASQT